MGRRPHPGGGLSGAAGSGFRDEFNLPEVESKKGFDILDERFGGQGTGVVGTIVFRAEQGVNKPEIRQAMQALFDRVARIESARHRDEVAHLQKPWRQRTARSSASSSSRRQSHR